MLNPLHFASRAFCPEVIMVSIRPILSKERESYFLCKTFSLIEGVSQIFCARITRAFVFRTSSQFFPFISLSLSLSVYIFLSLYQRIFLSLSVYLSVMSSSCCVPKSSVKFHILTVRCVISSLIGYTVMRWSFVKPETRYGLYSFSVYFTFFSNLNYY